MGEITSIQCRACGEKWQCMEGSGLLYGKKENIIAAFSEQEKEQVIAQMDRSEIPAYDFAFRIAVCGRCHNIVSVPTLTVGEEETYVGDCPQCGQKTKKPIIELKRTACPVCKSRALHAENEGNWD